MPSYKRKKQIHHYMIHNFENSLNVRVLILRRERNQNLKQGCALAQVNIHASLVMAWTHGCICSTQSPRYTSIRNSETLLLSFVYASNLLFLLFLPLFLLFLFCSVCSIRSSPHFILCCSTAGLFSMSRLSEVVAPNKPLLSRINKA